MSFFSGAPTRPVSSGVGARDAIANQPNVIVPLSSQLCKSMFDDHGVKRAGAKCNRNQSGRCPNVHSLSELRMPIQHCLYSGEKGEISLTFSDWGTENSASLTTTLSKCYRTKLSEAISNGSQVRANLCYDWLFLNNCKTCPRWSNCWFLHPTADVLTRMRQFFCLQNTNSSPCDSVRCPYAHKPQQLDVSLDFVRSVDAKAKGDTVVEVVYTDGQKKKLSVPKMMLLNTHGRSADSRQMCSDQKCDVTLRCKLLHIHPAQWNRGVDAWAQVVPHPGYIRASPPQQFMWLKTIRENSDPALFAAPPVDVKPSQQTVSRTVCDELALRHDMYAHSMDQLGQPIDSRADILAVFLLWTSNTKTTPENAAIISKQFGKRTLVLLYELLHQKVEKAPAAVVYVWLITCFESIKIYAAQYSSEPAEALAYCEGASELLKKTEKRPESFIGVLHKEISAELEKIKMLAD